MPRPRPRPLRRRPARSRPAARGTIPAGQFKATCLAVMEEVRRTGEPVTVTKHGSPVVHVVPAAASDAPPLFGRMRGVVRIAGDLLAPLDVEWDALADD